MAHCPGHCCFLPQQEHHNSDVTAKQFHVPIPCRCGKGPRAVVLRTRSSLRSGSACPGSSSEAGSTPGRARRQEANGQRRRHSTCDPLAASVRLPPEEWNWYLGDASRCLHQTRAKRQPPGAGRAAPSWHRTSSSLLSRVPTSHGNTSSKTRKQPWGEGSPRKGEPRETTWRSWILQEAAAPEAGGACSHRRPVCGGGGGRGANRHYVRRKSKTRAAFHTFCSHGPASKGWKERS